MKNDPLFVNKIAAAILTAGLMAMVIPFATGFLYGEEDLAEDVYVIAAEEPGAGAAPVAEEPKGPAEVGPLLASADVEAGLKLAKRCTACHAFEDGGPNKTGPALWNIVNAPKGGIDGYKYSDALAGFGGNWGYEELNQFLYNPKAYVKGTKMAFKGLNKDKDRANMIAYLRSLSANPAPLP